MVCVTEVDEMTRVVFCVCNTTDVVVSKAVCVIVFGTVVYSVDVWLSTLVVAIRVREVSNTTDVKVSRAVSVRV